MEEEYLEDPLIEFVKVEGNNDFDHRFVNDAEIEDPNLLPRPKKIRKIVRYHTISNTGTRKVVQVKQFTRKNEVMSTMPMPYSNGIRKIAHIRQIAKNNDGVSTTSVPENYANRNIVKHLTSKREDEIRRKKRLIEAHHPNKEEKRYKKNMIPMSEEKTIALISRIEKEPCIWDRKHDNYRNKDIKEKAWNRVVGNTGIPLQILKAKWASILGSFRHYKSQHIKYQGGFRIIFSLKGN
uniref:MADF domain-containing protein n=1 Tax=Anopheles christyi TaxID=43041 RepID=A0A182JUE7_9DIPT